MKDETSQVAGIVNNIRRVFQVLNEQSQQVKRLTGLTGPQLWTIKTIAAAPPVSVKDLAARIHLHPATVVGILDRLEEGGFVRRIRTQVDRRVVTVGLTEKGRGLVAGAPEAIQGMLVSGLKRLPAGTRKRIDDGLAELVRMLGVETVPTRLVLSDEVHAGSRKVPGGDAERVNR
jgi:DNA-binding MarR family transcriptional regulator